MAVNTRGRTWWPVSARQLVVAFCLVSRFAPADAAEPAHVFSPRPGDTLWVGSTVDVSWHPLPTEAKEMELFLSLDGGATYPLRLTPQMAPGLTSWRWSVPNLPTEKARLRLRVGIPGRGEVDGPPSGVFRIVHEARVVAEPVRWYRGELWLGLGGDSPPPAPLSMECSHQEALVAAALSLLAELPRRETIKFSRISAEKIVVVEAGGTFSYPPPPVPRETTPRPLRR